MKNLIRKWLCVNITDEETIKLLKVMVAEAVAEAVNPNEYGYGFYDDDCKFKHLKTTLKTNINSLVGAEINRSAVALTEYADKEIAEIGKTLEDKIHDESFLVAIVNRIDKLQLHRSNR